MRTAPLSWPHAQPRGNSKKEWINALTFLLPPLAVRLAGETRAVPLNVLLTLLGWIPGIVHARRVVARASQFDVSANQLVNALAHHVRR